MSLQVQQPAPDFTAKAVVGREFKESACPTIGAALSSSSSIRWTSPLSAPTEIGGFGDELEEFETRGAQVIAVSVDSHFTHLAWKETPRKAGGIGDVRYPIISDLTKAISRSYGVLLETQGIALRGLFLIDGEGVLRHMVVNNLSIGRSIKEAIRVLEALRFVERNGEVCPAGRQPGAPTIKPEPGAAKDFFMRLAS